jgi:hypothetical protein
MIPSDKKQNEEETMHIEDTGRLDREEFEMLIIVFSDEEKMNIQKLFSTFSLLTSLVVAGIYGGYLS